jgi:transposase-like protein
MRQKSQTRQTGVAKAIKDIRRATRKQYSAEEKIRLVEQSYLPIKQTSDKLGIPHTTFYRWYDRYQIGGPEALEDQSPRPLHV